MNPMIAFGSKYIFERTIMKITLEQPPNNDYIVDEDYTLGTFSEKSW